MHAKGIGRNKPKVLPFKGERERERERERVRWGGGGGTWLNERGESLSWDK